MEVSDNYSDIWNGISWSVPIDIGNIGTLLSVSCPSSSLCVALAGNGGTYALTWNGSSWSEPIDIDTSTEGVGPTLASVSCPSSSFSAAVDESGYAVIGTTGAVGPTVSVTDNSHVTSIGGNLTFTSTVTGSGVTPTGTVMWTLTGPGSPTCAESTLVSGIATCSVSDAQSGTYTATADYSGDSNYSTASGTDDDVDIGVTTSATPTVSVTDDSQGVAPGGDFTYTATVTGTVAMPTGMVTWALTGPGSPTCATLTLSSGKATCTVSDAQARHHLVAGVDAGRAADALELEALADVDRRSGTR